MFKEAGSPQIFDSFDAIPVACKLVAADDKRGLVYLCHNNVIVALKLGTENNIEWKVQFELLQEITQVAVNCDQTLLAIVPNRPSVLIYNAASITKGVRNLFY